MLPPQKPFPNYKWQWATVTCTEGLNYPPVFLGVLRTLKNHEGSPPSDSSLISDLRVVQINTKTDVNLVRSADRNLIRNSGQYWKALDLIKETRGNISLTEFGRNVADGNISSVEFATTVVKTLELPNLRIYTNIPEWQSANLNIKPLELILSILAELMNSQSPENAYITSNELIKIVIPLAGEKSPISKHIQAIMMFRENELDLTGWPDCAIGANDKRMAREFLLFLSYYGFCTQVRNLEERYYLSNLEPNEIDYLIEIESRGDTSLQTVRKLRKLSSEIERKKVFREVTSRPQQPAFRENILNVYEDKCLITGIKLTEVLEASHIVPVKYDGTDTIDNGICLRVDIHRLFDSGHLRINPDGTIYLSENASFSYRNLPTEIDIPSFVAIDNLEWRWRYF